MQLVSILINYHYSVLASTIMCYNLSSDMQNKYVDSYGDDSGDRDPPIGGMEIYACMYTYNNSLSCVYQTHTFYMPDVAMGISQSGVNELKSIKATSHIELYLSGTDNLISAYSTAHHDQQYQSMAETWSQFEIGQLFIVNTCVDINF